MEQEKLKEKLDGETHKAAKPLEELTPDDPYFTRIQGMLAIRSELENIPLSNARRDILLAINNVLEQAWISRNTPVPDRCMDPENISEVVYYFSQDKDAGHRADLFYNRAKTEFDACMEEVATLSPKEILGYTYEKVIEEEFLCQMEDELPGDTANVLLAYPQPLAVLFSEWMDSDYSLLDCIVDTMQDAVQRREKELRSCQLHANGEPPQELKDYYKLYGEELDNPNLEPVGEVGR